jgi:hypothetical protein
VRVKAQLVAVLIDQLEVSLQAVKSYSERIERFFASTPAAELTKTLPGGKRGTIVPKIWAELGDAAGRWESFRHLQAQAGVVRRLRRAVRAAWCSFVFLATRSCATRPTGLRLSRLTEVSGPITTIVTNAPKDIVIIRP